MTTIETSSAVTDVAPDPNLSEPLTASLAVFGALAFAMGCGWWRKQQILAHHRRRLKIVASLEALFRRDSK